MKNNEQKTVGMVSLGCCKNQVDAEKMLAALQQAGFAVTGNQWDADAVIINTCGFIEDAKREAIENILEVAALKKEGRLKAVIVTGCLAERYRDQIMEELPEVDAVVGIGANQDIAQIVSAALEGRPYNAYGEKTDFSLEGERVLSTPFYTAYLKIAEGCDNCCTYCAIPMIRGRFRSRKLEDILAEAKTLAAQGVKELVVVAQDTTRYGEDLYGAPRLCALLQALTEIEGIEWVRTLYTYPERITDELIDLVAGNAKLTKYFDIPIQHCNNRILQRMNRRGDKQSIEALLDKLRARIPGVTLRTTLIAGFPGETEEEFAELCDFVQRQRFDRLGCFAYSPEEDTPAAGFPGQLEEQQKADRAEIIMQQQLRIAEEKNAAKFGTRQKVLIEGYDNYIKCYFGRSESDAPEVDGKIFFVSDTPLNIGDFAIVRINDCIDYDLLGEKINEPAE